MDCDGLEEGLKLWVTVMEAVERVKDWEGVKVVQSVCDAEWVEDWFVDGDRDHEAVMLWDALNDPVVRLKDWVVVTELLNVVDTEDVDDRTSDCDGIDGEALVV